ncbi:hypothetical protein [Nocardia sp. alder85J]|uniref:hypothetical protein n=1 Tax=Nocardia sp. alder85J TaxID=2862949 RepID=UPI001CD4E08D|nr:hypothetical protein [Nocardia sp. alder85J]MCX4098417.1 hypothetical protein [Nocardia sp. alder85J]
MAAVVTVAAPLFEPAYRHRVGDLVAGWWPVAGVVWVRWAATGMQVIADVQVTAEEHPADTASSVSRVLAVTLHPSGGESLIRFGTDMRAVRAGVGGSWLVDSLEVLA